MRQDIYDQKGKSTLVFVRSLIICSNHPTKKVVDPSSMCLLLMNKSELLHEVAVPVVDPVQKCMEPKKRVCNCLLSVVDSLKETPDQGSGSLNTLKRQKSGEVPPSTSAQLALVNFQRARTVQNEIKKLQNELEFLQQQSTFYRFFSPTYPF